MQSADFNETIRLVTGATRSLLMGFFGLAMMFLLVASFAFASAKT